MFNFLHAVAFITAFMILITSVFQCIFSKDKLLSEIYFTRMFVVIIIIILL